jgi:hypothetical protein
MTLCWRRSDGGGTLSMDDAQLAGESIARWALHQLYLREAVSREAGYFDGRVTGRDELLYWAPEAIYP